jgi:hypothetical protein
LRLGGGVVGGGERGGLRPCLRASALGACAVAPAWRIGSFMRSPAIMAPVPKVDLRLCVVLRDSADVAYGVQGPSQMAAMSMSNIRAVTASRCSFATRARHLSMAPSWSTRATESALPACPSKCGKGGGARCGPSKKWGEQGQELEYGF